MCVWKERQYEDGGLVGCCAVSVFTLCLHGTSREFVGLFCNKTDFCEALRNQSHLHYLGSSTFCFFKVMNSSVVFTFYTLKDSVGVACRDFFIFLMR